ncbi:hypothetical protein TNCV_4701901 [Trichonephila clavipes]|uniref:Uncharacterized protein n=1 Tax=Trichonephila clavipes TaxID=2585209 RepID=A0A8X6WI22_TRICX|nr:hypothetical protein TNCV_4701901 [Trichonephila clavipes]
MNEVKWIKRRIFHHLKRAYCSCTYSRSIGFEGSISLGSQKQSHQRFLKVGIRTHSPSPEDVAAVRAQFSKSVIGGVGIVRQNRDSTVLQLTQIVSRGLGRTMHRE